LQKEQEQLNKAWQDGAVTAQNDAAKEIEKNYVARVR
jgi:monoamine oxidase